MKSFENWFAVENCLGNIKDSDLVVRFPNKGSPTFRIQFVQQLTHERLKLRLLC